LATEAQRARRRRWITDSTDSTDEEKMEVWVEARRQEGSTASVFSSPWHSPSRLLSVKSVESVIVFSYGFRLCFLPPLLPQPVEPALIDHLIELHAVGEQLLAPLADFPLLDLDVDPRIASIAASFPPLS
jgi:hypothetical protein